MNYDERSILIMLTGTKDGRFLDAQLKRNCMVVNKNINNINAKKIIISHVPENGRKSSKTTENV